MNRKVIILTAAATIVIAAGIAISCTKEADTVDCVGMPTTVAAKSHAQEAELYNRINLFYRKCVAAYHADSVGFMYTCAKEDKDGFFQALHIDSTYVLRMMELADSIYCQQPQPHPGASERKDDAPSHPTDTCSKCTDTSLIVISSNIIEIHRLAQEMIRLDSTFNADYPITMTPMQLCIERCRLDYEAYTLMHYLCWMSCVYGKEMERITEEYEILVQANPKL